MILSNSPDESLLRHAMLPLIICITWGSFQQLPNCGAGDDLLCRQGIVGSMPVGRAHACRESPASRIQIETIVGEVNLNSNIDRFSKVGTVLEVSCTPIDLMNHHASGFPMLQQAQYFGEDWTSEIGYGLLLLK